MDNKRTRMIIYILLLAFVISSAIGVSEYKSINKAIVSGVKSIVSNIDSSLTDLKNCATDKEKEQCIYYLSFTTRLLNSQNEELTYGIFHNRYSLNELWRYISMIRADSDNIEETIEKYLELNEMIQETGILDIVNNEHGISMMVLREKINEINTYCKDEICALSEDMISPE